MLDPTTVATSMVTAFRAGFAFPGLGMTSAATARFHDYVNENWEAFEEHYDEIGPRLLYSLGALALMAHRAMILRVEVAIDDAAEDPKNTPNPVLKIDAPDLDFVLAGLQLSPTPLC